jgi:hypothetical protein
MRVESSLIHSVLFLSLYHHTYFCDFPSYHSFVGFINSNLHVFALFVTVKRDSFIFCNGPFRPHPSTTTHLFGLGHNMKHDEMAFRFYYLNNFCWLRIASLCFALILANDEAIALIDYQSFDSALFLCKLCVERTGNVFGA